MLEYLRRWLSRDTPAVPELVPAEVTIGRVEAFYSLLCDLGFDEMLSKAKHKSDTGMQPVSLKQQSETDEGIDVQIDLTGLFRAITDYQAMRSLAVILFVWNDGTPAVKEDVENMTASKVFEALAPFAQQCFALTGGLMAFVAGSK